jgi:hypothetical protein
VGNQKIEVDKMNNPHTLAQVRAKLDALPVAPGDAADPQTQYDQIESIAIAILDSEFTDFTPGALEEYLHSYLYLRQLELGLIPFPDPREE